MATKNTAPTAAQPELFDDVHTKFEAYTGKEPYLFVSYSHRDSKVVYSILDELYDHKYRLWYDESCENGNDFRDELRQKIKAAEAVILFVSQWSMASPFCGMEIIVAREYGKRLYPIYLDDSVIPPAFEILLSNTHHSTVKDRKKLISTMIRDLPAEAMDRLTIENDRLEKCEDNGKAIQVDEGITVSGDEEALRRVLEILLDNAQKYSSPGGETQVTLHRRGRNHCALTVANQGEPIPPEARRQIFQRFYRADPARSRNGSFGLGLSIAEGIVAQHHGTIDVTCAGGFNRFWAELPCRQE